MSTPTISAPNSFLPFCPPFLYERQCDPNKENQVINKSNFKGNFKFGIQRTFQNRGLNEISKSEFKGHKIRDVKGISKCDFKVNSQFENQTTFQTLVLKGVNNS